MIFWSEGLVWFLFDLNVVIIFVFLVFCKLGCVFSFGKEDEKVIDF